jgi:hypothetical protein
MVQVDYNHDKQFLKVNSKYVDLIQRKMFYPFIDNPGLQYVQDVFQRQILLQMSNLNLFIIQL